MSNDEGRDPLHTKGATGPPPVCNPYPFDIHHSVFDIQYFLQTPTLAVLAPWRLSNAGSGSGDVEVLGLGVVQDDGGRGLLGVELELLGKLDADPLRL